MPWFWIFYYLCVCVQKSSSGTQARAKELDVPTEEDYEKQQHTGFQNGQKVYRSERLSIVKIMKNKRRLCLDKSGSNIVLCDEDTAENFLCLFTISGKVDSCEKLSRKDFVIHLCEASNKVFTCGKFSTGPVCELDGRTKGLCKKRPYRQQLCWTNEGKLEVCKKGRANEGEAYAVNDGDDDDDEEEEDYDDSSSSSESYGGNLSSTEDNDGQQEKKQKKKREKPIPEVYKEETHRGKFDENDYEEIYSKDDDDGMLEPENFKGKIPEKHDVEESVSHDFAKKETDFKDYDTGTFSSQVGALAHIKHRQTRERYEDGMSSEIEPILGELIKLADNEGYPENEYEGYPENENEGYPEDDNEGYPEQSNEGYPEEDNEGYPEDEDEARQEDNGRVGKMRRKLLKRIFDIHRNNVHLCKKLAAVNERLFSCDDVKMMRFACIGTYSRKIKACKKFKNSEVALAVCSQASTGYLVTCDLASNAYLCLTGDKGMHPCKEIKDFVCLEKDGIPSRCQEEEEEEGPPTRTPEMAEHPDNERFYHLHCSNCTIDNKMVVVGTPEDVLPETEFFTFPSA